MSAVLEEQEYTAIKKELKYSSPKTLALAMKRSLAVILRIKGTKNYTEYKELVRSEHVASKKYKPQAVKIREAKLEELYALRKELFVKKAIRQRIAELKGRT